MPDESSPSIRLGTAETPLPGLTRRRLLQAGALAAASLLLPPAPARAARQDRRLLAVPFHYQYHALSCELATLRMAAEYHGQYWTENGLLGLLPIDDSQPRYRDGSVVWADPNRAFPGNIWGWQIYHGGLAAHPERARRGQWGYGVHAPVLAEMAVRIGLLAELFDQVEAVYAAINRGSVPIVIVPDGGRDRTIRWRWRTPQGEPVAVINAEHSVVVRGYDGDTVWINDPKGKVWSYPRDRFERAFAHLRSGVTIGPGCTLTPCKFIPR